VLGLRLHSTPTPKARHPAPETRDLTPKTQDPPMNKMISWLTNPPTDGPKSTLILRLMAGGAFFWEGLLKFVYAN